MSNITYPDQDFKLPEGYTTKIEISKPAHEQFHEDPRQNYGIGCVHMTFTLVNPARTSAIAFEVFTGWYLPQSAERLRADRVGGLLSAHSSRGALEGHAGRTWWHRSEPMFDGHEMADDCHLLVDGKCYCDVGFTIGDDIWDVMVAGGEPALWKKLLELLDD